MSRLAVSVPLAAALVCWAVAALGHCVLQARRPLPDLLMPDGFAVTPLVRPLRASGLVLGDPPPAESSVYAVFPAGRVLPCPVTVGSNQARVALSVSGLSAGMNSIVVAGMPFSALSHVRQTLKWKGVASDQPVQVLEAQAMLRWLRQDPSQVFQLVRTLQNHGSLVLLFVGRTTDYVQARDMLGRDFKDLPCMAQLTAPGSTAAAALLLHRALSQGERRPPVRLLTTETSLALDARRRLGTTLEAWIVTQDPTPTDTTRAWRTHYRSLEALLEALETAK